MAVLGSAIIRQRLWRGYDSPGLPVGMWASWVNVQHDVSGGDAVAAILFQPGEGTGSRVDGRFYNVEQLEIFSTLSTNPVASLLIVNFSIRIDGALTNREITIPLGANEGGNTASAYNTLPKQYFLGQAAIPGTPAALHATINNVDGEDHTMWAEGYIWEPRSTQAEGGLRRPIDSLYG